MAGDFGFKRAYADYREMLETEELDVVSMCLWPALHLPAILACVEASHPPKLINAEKPMAPTFGEARRMHEACERAGIMLTFSHQRRFGATFGLGRQLICEGAIGDLKRMEMDCSNLFDWGTHWFDMMLFYNDDLDPDWVMGQVGCAEDRLVFGARVETAGLSYIKWPNGVTGLLTTGAGTGADCQIRVIGSTGMLEVDHGKVRVLREGATWEQVPPRLGPIPGGDTTRHIIDSVACLREGRQSIVCSENALRATELIFATYQSARTRSRAFLPLDVDDSPLLTMIERQELVIPDWPAFLTEEEQEEGFELLFNGKNLSGWKASADCEWSVRWGILRADPQKPGLLRTIRTFDAFELTFEFRVGSRAEAALVLGLQGRDSAAKQIEIPLKDDRSDSPDVQSTGAIRGVTAPAQNPRVGGSAWGWCTVTCNGDDLHVNIKDVDVQHLNLKDCPELAGKRLSGAVGMRSVAGNADFRNILIKSVAG
jgi:predicted dehydrogenase